MQPVRLVDPDIPEEQLRDIIHRMENSGAAAWELRYVRTHTDETAIELHKTVQSVLRAAAALLDAEPSIPCTIAPLYYFGGPI